MHIWHNPNLAIELTHAANQLTWSSLTNTFKDTSFRKHQQSCGSLRKCMGFLVPSSTEHKVSRSEWKLGSLSEVTTSCYTLKSVQVVKYSIPLIFIYYMQHSPGNHTSIVIWSHIDLFAIQALNQRCLIKGIPRQRNSFLINIMFLFTRNARVGMLTKRYYSLLVWMLNVPKGPSFRDLVSQLVLLVWGEAFSKKCKVNGL